MPGNADLARNENNPSIIELGLSPTDAITDGTILSNNESEADETQKAAKKLAWSMKALQQNNKSSIAMPMLNTQMQCCLYLRAVSLNLNRACVHDNDRPSHPYIPTYGFVFAASAAVPASRAR